MTRSKRAQVIYQAGNRQEALEACRCFAARWRKSYPTVVRQLQKDLPKLLSFFHFPQHLWRSYGPPTSSLDITA